MPFIYHQKVRFRHCDPAGIVFYPRYFEMMNDTVEDFFEKVVLLPFSGMHQDCGVPTAGIEAQFQAPTRLGDQLEIGLTITRLGRSSLGFAYDARCGGEQRFTATSTVVFIDSGGRPAAWPGTPRARLEEHMKKETSHGA
ncbi:1,4-dihydroxy-2-naphthoyl-CoA hydrolase (plasmid) [Sulfitobacter sp. THAF37]|uniref:acyl-CoA thioesterase n=1 Tax=Sulfitobacter sp. THAF37 TaxID=2587855 RepID=UPI0012690E39|nr:thioesterase family protein [Sulfitobacter sp. THAF37]QFT61116.1 1,4-dihydroxy-2-naphthoyl-CoA hydrolase [Sulfitobacter sp. THAF37]